MPTIRERLDALGVHRTGDPDARVHAALDLIDALRTDLERIAEEHERVREALRDYVEDDECKYGMDGECGPDESPCRYCRGRATLDGKAPTDPALGTVVDRLVDRFLAWPLPDSVCPDGEYPAGKSREKWGAPLTGTNLLSADEARQLFVYVLGAICEVCGQPGATATNGGWYCPRHNRRAALDGKAVTP